MEPLRERLKEGSDVLYQSFQKSWDIAWNVWLPALPLKKDSFNSYPHLRNVENHLCRVLADARGKAGAVPVNNLSPAEIYLLLCSVLFHDIGRIGGDGDNTCHASCTRRLLEEHWAELGVANEKFAELLGRVCEFHDPPEGYHENLHDTTVDPWGEIRLKLLAALLRFADHLDSAFTRILPAYLKGQRDYHVVARFRKLINDVKVDMNAQLVKTVVCDTEEEHFSPEDPSPIYKVIMKDVDQNREDLKKISPVLSAAGIRVRAWLMEHNEQLYRPIVADGKRDKEMAARGFNAGSYERYLGKVCASLREKNATVMSSLPIKETRDLYAPDPMGYQPDPIEVPSRIAETFEPIFHKQYLLNVCASMWKLSTQIFGSSVLSYEDLAADVREPNVSRIKMAVRRLQIVTRGKLKHNEVDVDAIWAGADSWQHTSGLRVAWDYRR